MNCEIDFEEFRIEELEIRSIVLNWKKKSGFVGAVELFDKNSRSIL
jgi:hypothetical protein